MARIVFGAGCALLILARCALALEAVGTVRKIDAEKSTLVVFAGGQERTLTADKDLKVVDEQGKELPEGLKSKELKTGATVTITVERENQQLLLKRLRLGAQQGDRAETIRAASRVKRRALSPSPR